MHPPAASAQEHLLGETLGSINAPRRAPTRPIPPIPRSHRRSVTHHRTATCVSQTVLCRLLPTALSIAASHPLWQDSAASASGPNGSPSAGDGFRRSEGVASVVLGTFGSAAPRRPEKPSSPWEFSLSCISFRQQRSPSTQCRVRRSTVTHHLYAALALRITHCDSRGHIHNPIIWWRRRLVKPVRQAALCCSTLPAPCQRGFEPPLQSLPSACDTNQTHS